jgi:hypothetical protein
MLCPGISGRNKRLNACGGQIARETNGLSDKAVSKVKLGPGTQQDVVFTLVGKTCAWLRKGHPHLVDTSRQARLMEAVPTMIE